MKIILFTVPKVSKVFEVRQFEEISVQNIEGGSLEMCHVFADSIFLKQQIYYLFCSL